MKLETMMAGAGIGAVLGAFDRKQGEKMSNRFLQAQISGQKNLMNHQHSLQMQLFDKTGYKAQMKQMIDAGLNPALMYGSAGGGGSTTPTGGSSLSTGTGMQGKMLDAMAIASQIEVAKSQARLNNAEAEVKESTGVEEAKTRIASLTQGIENQRAVKELTEIQTELTEIDAKFAEELKSGEVRNMLGQYDKLIAETISIGYENDVSSQTIREKVNIIKADAVGKLIENELNRNKIDFTKQQIEESKQRIEKMLADVRQRNKEIDIKDVETALKSEFPSLINVLGGQARELVYNLHNILGGGRRHSDKEVEVKNRENR